MTFAFTASLLRAAGGRVREVRVERLTEGTFYATVVVEVGDGSADVDARPSDALNLALVAGTPIRTTAEVIRQAEAAEVDYPGLPTAQALMAEGTTGAHALMEETQEKMRQALSTLRRDPT
jgi:bifunctional DNase/RNase